MKNTILYILAVLLFALQAWAQSGDNFTVPLSDPAKRGKLKVDIHYGSVTIKGTARKDVVVSYSSAKDEGNATSKDGLKRIGGGGLDLEASELNNQVIIQSSSWSVKTDLEIEIPSGMDIDASTYNDGDILISNVQGTLELENYNGEIKATNISGSVIASTYNGDVKVTFDKVTENTPMSFSTFNGDVDLTFPATYKATFKMKTEQGEIFTGFDMNITSSAPVQKKDTKSGAFKLVIDEWKKGDINGGGPEITMKNYNGDIYIRKK